MEPDGGGCQSRRSGGGVRCFPREVVASAGGATSGGSPRSAASRVSVQPRKVGSSIVRLACSLVACSAAHQSRLRPASPRCSTAADSVGGALRGRCRGRARGVGLDRQHVVDAAQRSDRRGSCRALATAIGHLPRNLGRVPPPTGIERRPSVPRCKPVKVDDEFRCLYGELATCDHCQDGLPRTKWAQLGGIICSGQSLVPEGLSMSSARGQRGKGKSTEL